MSVDPNSVTDKNTPASALWIKAMRVPWPLRLAANMPDLKSHCIRRCSRRFKHGSQMRPVFQGFRREHVRLQASQHPLKIVEDALIVPPLRKKKRQDRLNRQKPSLELRSVLIHRVFRHFSSSLVSVSEDYRRSLVVSQRGREDGPDFSRLAGAMLLGRQA